MNVRSTKDKFVRWLTNSNVHISYSQGWRRCQGDEQYLFFLFLFLISFLLSWSNHFYILILCVEGYCCTSSHSMTHTHTHTSVGVLWTRDQPVVLTSTWRLTTLTRHRHPCSDGIRTSNPSKKRPQPYALDCTATGFGQDISSSRKFITNARECNLFLTPLVQRCEDSFEDQRLLYVKS